MIYRFQRNNDLKIKEYRADDSFNNYQRFESMK